jgi:hypothetical protein
VSGLGIVRCQSGANFASGASFRRAKPLKALGPKANTVGGVIFSENRYPLFGIML